MGIVIMFIFVMLFFGWLAWMVHVDTKPKKKSVSTKTVREVSDILKEIEVYTNDIYAKGLAIDARKKISAQLDKLDR